MRYILVDSESEPALRWRLRLPYSIANDPQHWRDLALETRRVAENLSDATARQHMIACAEAYERLAIRAEKYPLYVRPSEPVLTPQA